MAKTNATEKIRMKAKRRRKIAAAIRVALLMILLTVALVVAANLMCHVGHIEFTGQSNYYASGKIIESSGIEYGSGLFRVSTSQVTKQLQMNCPMLGEIKVRHVMPSTIEIYAVDVVPDIAFKDGDKIYLYGYNGVIVQQTTQEGVPSSAVVISGLDLKKVEVGKKPRFKDANLEKEVTKLIENIKVELPDLSAIDCSDMGNIKAFIDDRYVIYLGSTSQIDYKIQMVKAVLEKQTFTQRTYLDASKAGKVITGIYVEPEPEPVVTEPESDKKDGSSDDKDKD